MVELLAVSGCPVREAIDLFVGAVLQVFVGLDLLGKLSPREPLGPLDRPQAWSVRERRKPLRKGIESPVFLARDDHERGIWRNFMVDPAQGVADLGAQRMQR